MPNVQMSAARAPVAARMTQKTLYFADAVCAAVALSERCVRGCSSACLKSLCVHSSAMSKFLCCQYRCLQIVESRGLNSLGSGHDAIVTALWSLMPEPSIMCCFSLLQ